MNSETTMARQIAAEDIQVGQYITKLHDLRLCAFMDDDGEGWKRMSKWRLPLDIEPYQVKGVCLPYVLVMDADGDMETFDARRHRFALLPKAYGRIPFDARKEGKCDDATDTIAAYGADDQ